MPWKTISVMDQRIEFVVRASDTGSNLSAFCREYGISRPTGYRWLRRYHQRESLQGLVELSRRPRHIPRQTGSEIEAEVVALRLAFDWGGKKIQQILAERGIAVSTSTVNRIIKRNGFVRMRLSQQKAAQRFERERPNQLWQMDFKGDYLIEQGKCYPLSILDDHSRFAVGLFALSDQLGHSVKRCLISTFEHYGVPEAILTDHGIPWWGNPNGHGLTRLSVSLIKQGIRLYFSGYGHPQTQGKVERFHRTLKHALWYRGEPKSLPVFAQALADFRNEYNHLRPHEALEMAVPARRYQPSSKAYNPSPPDWEYPERAIVRRLNTQGCLDYQHRRYFVCEALAGENVQIEHIEDKMAVRYRHMYVRELDQNTGRSSSLLKPAPKT